MQRLQRPLIRVCHVLSENIVVDGWDFDIESDPNSQNSNYQYLIDKLRSYFESDTEHTYYISGAPPVPTTRG